jgi:ABC-type uncharacterized transport system auxiliary subunit
VPKTHYYTLQVPAAPSPSDPKTNYVVGVEHFRSPEMLRDDRVAYYESPTEVNFYQYHRWGGDPASMLSKFTAQWLDATGAFAEVRMLPSRPSVDYTVAGRVLNFEEVDEGGGKARVGLELTLMRMSDHKVVWSGEQHVEAPLQGGGVEGVASTLNASCAQMLRAMIPGLIAQVEQDFKSSGK